MHLADLLPSADELLRLAPEKLGLCILQVVGSWSPYEALQLSTFLNATLGPPHASGPARYPNNRRSALQEAIETAWAWLEGQAFLIPDPRYGSGVLKISSRGQKLASKTDHWLSAPAAITFLKSAMTPTAAAIAIAARAHDGIVRSRADRFVRGTHVQDDVELPREFWWARGHEALEQNWTTGDFETWIDQREHWKAYGVRFLRSQIEKMKPELLDSAVSPHRPKPPTRKVFIVHGHDEGAREAVARFLEKIGFEAVILHEKAGRGLTVIEKVEAHSDVGFAVVLLTPDDEGCVKGGLAQPRARQNVLLELGYFVGRLGRQNVCALKRGELEIPSDFGGIVYTSFDASGGWRQELGRELEAAGFNIDWNKVMR